MTSLNKRKTQENVNDIFNTENIVLDTYFVNGIYSRLIKPWL